MRNLQFTLFTQSSYHCTVHFHLDGSLISLSRSPRDQLGCNQSAAVEKGCVQKKSLYDRIAILLPPSLFNDGTNRFWLKFELVVYMSKSLVACRFYFAKSHLLKQKEICSKILKYWVYCTTHQAAPKIDFSLWVPYDWLSLQNWSSHHPENREVSHKLDSFNKQRGAS